MKQPYGIPKPDIEIKFKLSFEKIKSFYIDCLKLCNFTFMKEREEPLKKLEPIEPEVKTSEELETAPDQRPKKPPGTK